MTIPIKPMSAEETVKNILDFHKIYPMSLKKHVRDALASHLVRVMEELKQEGVQSSAVLAVLQSEIDKLTK